MNLKPIQLEEIRLSAMHGARGIRARGVECRAVLLLFNATPAGELGGLTVMDIDDADKDTRAALQKKFARDPEIAAAVMINEAWQVIRTPAPENARDEIKKIAGHVAEQPDRTEVLIVSAMTAAEHWMLFAEIHGTQIDDAQFQKIEPGEWEGRFIREEARA